MAKASTIDCGTRAEGQEVDGAGPDVILDRPFVEVSMMRYRVILLSAVLFGLASAASAAPTKNAGRKKSAPVPASHKAQPARPSRPAAAALPAVTPAVVAPAVPAVSSSVFGSDLRGKLEKVGVGGHVKLLLQPDRSIAGKIVSIGPGSVTIDAETGNRGTVEVASSDIGEVVAR